MIIDLELVRTNWGRLYGRGSGKTIERIVEFLGSLELSSKPRGLFLVEKITDLNWLIPTFKDVMKQMEFEPVTFQNKTTMTAGPYTIKFVSKNDERALLGVIECAIGEDHHR